MADYYLINDQIKFYFDIEDQYIEFQDNRESLEPKEAKILKYIIENSVDGLIKSENILDNNWDYWNDKKVLQKVLSTLRRKFKLIGVIENGFIAAGTDYKINYHGVLVNDQDEQRKAKKAYNHKLLSTINSAAIWSFLGAVTLFLFLKSNEGPGFTVDNIIQATALNGVALAPAISPDGKAIVFSHKTEDTSKLYLKTENSISYQTLTEGFQDQIPAWSPSGRRVAFQRYGPDFCEIRVIEFDQKYQKLGDDVKLLECGIFTHYTSISWSSEDQFFYTNRVSNKSNYDIMSFNFNTQQSSIYYSDKKQLSDSVSTGPGHYFITYDHKQDTLYSLSSPDWYLTNINKFNKDKTPTLIYQVEDTLLSIATYNNHVVFKDLDNQLKVISASNSEVTTTIYQNPLKPISYPKISIDSNKLILLSGSFFKDSIYAFDLKTRTPKKLISSQFRLRMPVKVNERIYYISNEAGINQIYSFNNGVRNQITNFTRNTLIVHFSVSKDHQWIAINLLDKTVLYHNDSSGLVKKKEFPLMSYPNFSLDNKRILLTTTAKDDNDNWSKNLVEFELNTITETGISVKNANFGIYHDEGIIFTEPEGGIKLFTLKGVFTIAADLQVNTPLYLSANKKTIFLTLEETKEQQALALQIDIDSKQVTQLPSVITEQITTNDNYLYYRKRFLSNITIFKGELVDN